MRRMPWGVIKSTYTIPELKYKDLNASGAVPGNGTFTLLNGLTLGTSAVTRIGRQIVIKSIHMKFDITGAYFSVGPTLPSTMCRAMIIFDSQPNGTTPNVSDLLEDTTTGLQALASTALRYSGRFKILYDKRWVVNNNLAATTTATWSQIFDEVYLKVNLKCNYANTSNGDVTDIDTGALWLFLTSDSGATANNPDVLLYNRIRFVDN